MSASIDLRFQDHASEGVRALAATLDPAVVNEVVGEAAATVYQQHFIAREKSHSPNSHYYGKAAKATGYQVVPGGVLISIAHVGIALHFFGGTVKAGKGISRATGRPTKYLTIPARDEAKGRTAADFDSLIILWGRNGPYALAKTVRTQLSVKRNKNTGAVTVGSRGVQGGEVLFWLKKEITVQKDPTVLPEPAIVTRAASRAILSLAERTWQRSTPTRGRTLDQN